MTVQSTHFQVKPLKRSAGKNVIAAAAYRAGQKLIDMRTGQIFDYTRKQKVEAIEILAPDDAPAWIKDRNRLWNEVEQSEKRKDAQLARKIEISLPADLSKEGREKLVFDFAKEHFVAAGMVADICIHGPGAGDDRNYHAHVLLTMRGIGSEGFGPKKREWNEKPVLDGWKTAWETACNTALSNEGSKVRVDQRSIKQRRQDALAAAEKSKNRIEKQRHMIEATRLDYIPRPNLPQTPYRMMVEGKTVPEKWTEKVQAWKEATQSRQEAHKRAEVMQEALDREMAVPDVPLDPHGAYKAIIEPLKGFDATDTTINTTAVALFAHDPVSDISGILTKYFPDIQDATDLRQVKAALDGSFVKRERVIDEIEPYDALDQPFSELKHSLRGLPDIEPGKPWANAERILTKFTNKRIAKTIIAAVDRLATLIQSEKIADLIKQKPEPTDPPSTGSKQPEQHMPPKPVENSGPGM